MTLEEVKINFIRETLLRFNGNKTHAARSLGITVRSVRLLVATKEELKSFRITCAAPTDAVGVLVIDADTGKVMVTADSVTQASRLTGVDGNCIRKIMSDPNAKPFQHRRHRFVFEREI